MCVCVCVCVCERERERECVLAKLGFLLVSVWCAGMCASIIMSELSNKVPSYFQITSLVHVCFVHELRVLICFKTSLALPLLKGIDDDDINNNHIHTRLSHSLEGPSLAKCTVCVAYNFK